MNNNRFKVTSFDKIAEEKTDWLWKPYIPYGCITCLVGDPGVGKSFLSTYIASVISIGGDFIFENDIEDKNESTCYNVIIQNAEDSNGGTIKKRLLSNGANIQKILIIELEDKNDTKGELTLKDYDILRNLIIESSAKLIIFDPLTYFLGDIDMNNATKVRSILQPINRLAEEFNISIIFIAHRNKGTQGGNQLHKLLGSIDIAGITRSIISVGKNPKNNDETLFIHTKANLCEKGVTLAFNIVDNKIIWLGERGYMVDDELLNDNEPKNSRKLEAKEFILDYLKNNVNVSYDDILNEAKKERISKSTLERARNELKLSGTIKNIRNGNESYWLIEENYSSDTHALEGAEMSKSEY